MSTVTGHFVGTLAYASPEQFRGGGETIDVRSDVYSLGMIAYELLTGRLPYVVGESVPEAATAVTGHEPPRPSAISPSINRDLEAVVLKALEKDKANRYQSPTPC